MKDVNDDRETVIVGGNSALRVGVVVLNSIDTLTAKIELLAARMENLEKRGSDPVQTLQKTLDQLSADLKMHVLTTEKPKATP